MPLDFLLADARKNGYVKKYNPKALLTNFVDATGGKIVKSADLLKKETDLRARESPWQECSHLKSVDGSHQCQKFVSYCAKEKCKPEWKE